MVWEQRPDHSGPRLFVLAQQPQHSTRGQRAPLGLGLECLALFTSRSSASTQPALHFVCLCWKSKGTTLSLLSFFILLQSFKHCLRYMNPMEFLYRQFSQSHSNSYFSYFSQNYEWSISIYFYSDNFETRIIIRFKQLDFASAFLCSPRKTQNSVKNVFLIIFWF